MKAVFQIEAVITKVVSMNKHMRIVIDTLYEPKDGEITQFFKMRSKPGWLTFNSAQIEPEDIVDLPPIKTDAKKTPSQKQRAVIYRLWEQDNMEHEVFDNYYNWYMEKLINKMKERLV